MYRLLRVELRARTKGMIGWSLGLIVFGAVYITVYPEVAKQMGDLGSLPIYEVLGMNFVNFESYIASVVINFLPILLGIYAIITSTGTLAGEEDQGTLELVMAQPVSRSAILSAKAISIGVAILVVLLFAASADALLYAAVKASGNADVSPWRLFFVVFSAWPITMAIAMIGLFFSAFVPKRRTAAMIAGVILVISYFGETLSGMVHSLEGVRFLSIFNYFDSTAAVFRDGVKAVDVIVLLAIALLFFCLALLSFNARNVSTSTWAWKRGRATTN